MHEKLNKVRKENPNFDRELVDNFAKIMPDLLTILIDGYMYDNHIGTKETAMLAEEYITNNKGEKVGLHWGYDEVLNTASNFVNLNETEFYPADLWVWANVRYGDLSEQREEVKPLAIFEFAVNDLVADNDYPFYDSSQKAYRWLKKAIENKEKD